jgi:hypothetical protein
MKEKPAIVEGAWGCQALYNPYIVPEIREKGNHRNVDGLTMMLVSAGVVW